MAAKEQYYDSTDEYLEQGDIFRVDLVTPIASTHQRIFRAADGRHGSEVFSRKVPAKVFSRPALESLLATIEQTPNYPNPFAAGPNTPNEMVVVESCLCRYFILATQTCDICGRPGGRKARPSGTVFPILTVANWCKTTPVLEHFGNTYTIHDFMTLCTDQGVPLVKSEEVDYASSLRIILDDWYRSGIPKDLKSTVGQITTFLDSYWKKGYVHRLKDDVRHEVPESYVDFTAPYTILRQHLLGLRGNRIARLASEPRHAFVHAMTQFYARPALSQPVEPGLPLKKRNKE